MTNIESALTALADPTRRAIFERVAAGPVAVGEIADGLPVSRPAVSQHLRVLLDARLVVAHREGTRRLYVVDREGLSAVRAWLDRFWAGALDAYKEAADAAGEEQS